RWRSLWISSSEHRMHRQVFINPAVALGVGDRPPQQLDWSQAVYANPEELEQREFPEGLSIVECD
ncbi:hypothetical protein, partial [Marinobacter persicus]|uniref:hypothetical protein n=1 Tax=Marinobacter persicus TaxID=930118 RepID=UPI001CA53E57